MTMVGHAQTNERVAELLRNLADRSPWLERPSSCETKETQPDAQLKQGRAQ